MVLSDLHNSEFGAYNSELVDVVQLVGGPENISSVAHCMIRLRFAVKDLNKADQEALKKIPGVLSVTPAA